MWVTAGKVIIIEKNREVSRVCASKIISILLEYEKEGQQSLPSLLIKQKQTINKLGQEHWENQYSLSFFPNRFSDIHYILPVSISRDALNPT